MLTFDIETLPVIDIEIIEQLAKTISPPGNIKLPSSIAKWHEENGAQALIDVVSKTSLDGLYGRIACIAWKFNDDDIFVTQSDNEIDSINEFYDAIRSYVQVVYHGGGASSQLSVCGHNLAGFDLPFLKARSIILGIKPPPEILKAMSAKPWDSCIADTMLMWSSDSQKRASMDKLCRAFGIKGKDGFGGSMVAEEWVNGSREKVREYCKDDVQRTYAMYKRITFTA